MKRWLISLAIAALASAAYALPSVADVEAEVHKGNYVQAQSMMHDVVVAKPGSAKAHYIYAEILAHNDKFADAAQEAALAKQLDPSLKFTKPETFNAFQQLLDRELQRAGRAPRAGASSLDNLAPRTSALPALPAQPAQRVVERSQGVPAWVWPAGLIVIALLAWRMLRPRLGAPSPAGAGYGPTPGYAPAPPYGGPAGGAAPSGGSGLLGVGLAAAGGVAAGMLAEKLLERGHAPPRDDALVDQDAFANSAPAIDSDARALEDRSVDFGTGNDWDDGGSVDLGGGGADDGGW